jgi:octaprenyl-diphosphate synthase
LNNAIGASFLWGSDTGAEERMQFRPMLPGGEALRPAPTGLRSGSTRAHIHHASEALALVAGDMAAAEVALRSLVASDVAAVTHIGAYLADSGGKRLRPALVALGARAIGVRDISPRLMCCGELIHLGSLLHDDVVDQGDVRRGRPSAHVVHGNAVTVLTGDYCVARALMVAGEEGGPEVAIQLARTVAEMAEGEVLQLQRAGDLDAGLEGYLEVIDRKSASLIAWCASAAALKAGQADAARALQIYGRLVGRAFQIVDDVLDYRTTADKLPGADLRERKVTLPLLLALDRVEGLREHLRKGPPQVGELGPLMHRVRVSGALDEALMVARSYTDEALAALAGLPEGEGRTALELLGRAVVERTS